MKIKILPGNLDSQVIEWATATQGREIALAVIALLVVACVAHMLLKWACASLFYPKKGRFL